MSGGERTEKERTGKIRGEKKTNKIELIERRKKRNGEKEKRLLNLKERSFEMRDVRRSSMIEKIGAKQQTVTVQTKCFMLLDLTTIKRFYSKLVT